MTWEQFEKQMERLRNTFDPKSFREERVKLFWAMVSDLPENFLKRQVDKMIIEFRISDFSEAAYAERRAQNSVRSMRELGDRPDFERGPERLKIVFEKMGIKSIDDALKGSK